MRRPIFLLPLSALLIAGLIVIYLFNNKSVLPTVANQTMPNDEDYFADNVELVKYAQGGSLYYEMQAVRITHNNASDTALVTHPMMTLYATKNVQWHIKANGGKLYNRQQAIDLSNNVIITKFEKNKNIPALSLTTNNVTLHPDSNTFTTSDAVTIITDTTSTMAIGMKANVDNNYIELLNNVRSHYGGK